MEEKTREELAIMAFSAMSNSFNINTKKFNELFHGEHRTCQQSMGKIMFSLIVDVADKYDNERSRYFDGRNEKFGMICSDIKKEMDKISEFWHYLPMV